MSKDRTRVQEFEFVAAPKNVMESTLDFQHASKIGTSLDTCADILHGTKAVPSIHVLSCLPNDMKTSKLHVEVEHLNSTMIMKYS